MRIAILSNFKALTKSVESMSGEQSVLMLSTVGCIVNSVRLQYREYKYYFGCFLIY